MAVAPHDPYAALRYRNFRLLFAGRFVAQIGEMMVSVGVGWELYERTRDPLALGLVGLVQMIPVILLSLPAGYLVDRWNRKQITLWSQVVLIACSLALAVISLTQGSIVLLYAVLAVIGAARAFNNPAESALTPQTVPPELYFNASTWSSTIWQLSAITGPAIGGFIIGLSNGAAPVYFANAAAGAVLVVALLMLRLERQQPANIDEPPLQALRAGWNFVRRTQIILGSISLDMFAVLFGGATFLLPIYAKDILHVDATGLGVLRAAPSIGALCMALFLSRRPPFKRAGTILLLAVAGFGVATIAFGVSTSFWFSLLMLALTGALDNISVVIRHTLVLTHTPDEMRGRVNAVNFLFIGTSNELGGFESGTTAALLGPVGSVVFGGFGTLAVVGLVAWFAPQLRRLQSLHDVPAVAQSEAVAAEPTITSSTV